MSCVRVQGDSLLRGAGSARGRGRGRGYAVSTAAGNIVRVREKPVAVDFDKVTRTLHKLNQAGNGRLSFKNIYSHHGYFTLIHYLMLLR